jgi:hypothetical protein
VTICRSIASNIQASPAEIKASHAVHGMGPGLANPGVKRGSLAVFITHALAEAARESFGNTLGYAFHRCDL